MTDGLRYWIPDHSELREALNVLEDMSWYGEHIFGFEREAQCGWLQYNSSSYEWLATVKHVKTKLHKVFDALNMSTNLLFIAMKLESVIKTLQANPLRWGGTVAKSPNRIEIKSDVWIQYEKRPQWLLWSGASGLSLRSHYEVKMASCLEPLMNAHWRLNTSALFLALIGMGAKLETSTSKSRGPSSEEDADVIEDVEHPDEVVATRDETLLHEQADHDWASNVEEMIRLHPQEEHPVSEERIFVYPYSRMPVEFLTALLHGSDLQHIRSKMSEEGYACSLPDSGAKVFLRPEQYAAVMQVVHEKQIRLKASHVIIAESLLPELEACVASMPSVKHVRVKKDGIFHLTDAPVVSTTCQCDRACTETYAPSHLGSDCAKEFMQSPADWRDVLSVERTFLCVARIVGSARSVAQSSTEAHGGLNPRRLATLEVE